MTNWRLPKRNSQKLLSLIQILSWQIKPGSSWKKSSEERCSPSASRRMDYILLTACTSCFINLNSHPLSSAFGNWLLHKFSAYKSNLLRDQYIKTPAKISKSSLVRFIFFVILNFNQCRFSNLS